MTNRLYFSSIFFLFGFLFIGSDSSTAEWTFKKERDGIRVYTRDLADSNLKELKITLRAEGTLNSILSLINDVDAYQNWVYRCGLSKTIERRSPLESIDYYIMDFPWPLSDRDLTVHSTIHQDPQTKVVTSITKSVAGVVDKHSEMVRISQHFNKWIFKPVNEKEVDVVYTLNSHPAGNIPDWLINMAIDQGPMESMKRFRNMLKTKKYKYAKIAGILDY